MENLTKSNQRRWAAQLALTTGLALLFLAVLLWGFGGAVPALADPGTFYVDGASGQDILTCGTTITPCQTISYTLNSRASGGDTIRVAQGTYTENLSISKPVTLTGGYEAVNWTRDLTQYETALDGSGNQTVWGDWDGGNIRSAVVISTGAGFEMWYEGWSTDGSGQIGRAASSDKVTWMKDAGNPLFGSGAPGAWDEGDVSKPFVLFDGGTYEMWYTANRRPTGYAASTNLEAGPRGAYPVATGYATSTNGITWTRHPDPVLEGGPEGAWDKSGIRDPYIVETGGTYTMWYGAWTDTTGQIGCATSPDGANWTKCAANPVFGPGNPGARHKTGPNDWDQAGMKSPVVLFHDGIYHMWYGGTGAPYPDHTWHIGYVTSTNGITWTRFLTAPVLSGTDGEWDEGSIAPGGVFFDAETYHMWYEANGQVGYAWSSDGISWTKSSNNPVLTPGTPTQWGDPVVRFQGGSDGAVLDGLMVMGGDALQGGGVLVYDAEVTIQNCTVDANRAWDAGAGIGVANSADVTIHNTRVTNNVRWGGGGGGAGLWVDGSTVTVTDSIFQHNEATHHPGGGIGLWVNASMSATNIIVVDNTNGGIYLTMGSTADLVNATIANNTGIGIDVASEDSTANLVNNILALNGDGDLNCEDACTVSYSDIGEALWPGTGNIDADPLFVDAANGDYHLQVGSPCINKGTSAGAPTHDIEGTPRDAAPDMGAYEWRFRIFLPLTLKNLM